MAFCVEVSLAGVGATGATGAVGAAGTAGAVGAANASSPSFIKSSGFCRGTGVARTGALKRERSKSCLVVGAA